MKFRDIKQFPQSTYSINVAWDYLEKHIRGFDSDIPLDMDPDYQREHVWTEEQKTAYLEYRLKGGKAGRDILTNCPGWMNDYRGPFEVLDGKQRITAVLDFMHDKVRAFGCLFSEFEDKLRFTDADFIWHVFDLDKREDVLSVYIGLNAGGTPHTQEEIDRVRALLEKERQGHCNE